MCSRRQKSYPEVAGLNVHKPSLRQSIALLALDEVICGPILPRIFKRIFTNLKKNVKIH